MLENPNRVDRFRRTRRWSVIALVACCAGVVSLVVNQATPVFPTQRPTHRLLLSRPHSLRCCGWWRHRTGSQPSPRTWCRRSQWPLRHNCQTSASLPPARDAFRATPRGRSRIASLAIVRAPVRCSSTEIPTPECGSGPSTKLPVEFTGGWFSLFKPACLAGFLPTHAPNVWGQWAACDRWHGFALNRINRIDPDLLIVTQSLSQAPQGVD